MKVREAAEYLTARGYHCSGATVRGLVKARKLRCYRPGVTGKGPMSFTAAQLDALLREAEVGPAGSADVAPAPRASRASSPKVAPAAVSPATPPKDRLARLAAERGT